MIKIAGPRHGLFRFCGARYMLLLVSLAYSTYKLALWNNLSVGIAPFIIGVFFFTSVQMLFMGFIGEYIGTNDTGTEPAVSG